MHTMQQMANIKEELMKNKKAENSLANAQKSWKLWEQKDVIVSSIFLWLAIS